MVPICKKLGNGYSAMHWNFAHLPHNRNHQEYWELSFSWANIKKELKLQLRQTWIHNTNIQCELHVFLPCVLHVAMSTREWKVFCQHFCFIWLHFWLLCYRGEKLDVTYLQPWVGIPSCQACTYTQHIVLFCPMEWNMFHLCVGALALLDRKMATCQGCRWKGLLSTGLLGGRVTWETLFFTFSSLGSFTAALGPFHSSIIQDSHEVEKLCDALWYTGEMLVISKCEAEVSWGFCFNERDFLDLK